MSPDIMLGFMGTVHRAEPDLYVCCSFRVEAGVESGQTLVQDTLYFVCLLLILDFRASSRKIENHRPRHNATPLT